jgi:predicted peptidase
MKWRVLLFFLYISLALIGSCRKNSTLSQRLPPLIPDTDTIPTDSIPEDSTENPEPPTYNQVAVDYTINDNVGGFYEALPPGYDTSSKKYPLLLFLHGGGELGDGKTQLHTILKNSLTKRLHQKTFPASFTVNGQEFSFIVISPQFQIWPRNKDIEDLYKYALQNYRVDSSRLYLAGLSMGGAATWVYAGSANGNKLAAIVPICGASWADSAVAKKIASNQVPGWAFHNVDDDAVTVNSTRRYVNIINGQNPIYPIRMTLWPSGGHDAWTLASDPEYREEGKNMYEWMLQFSR